MKTGADVDLFQVPCENCFKRGCGSICPTGDDRVLESRFSLRPLQRILDHGERQSVSALTLISTILIRQSLRLILTSTAELHDKIDSMSARIRELEEALAKKSDGPQRISSGNNSLDAQNNMEKTSDSTSNGSSSYPNDSQTDSFIDAFGIPNYILWNSMMTHLSGTLTIGVRGETSFMSSTARSEVCLIICRDASAYDRIS